MHLVSIRMGAILAVICVIMMPWKRVVIRECIREIHERLRGA